MPHGNTPKTIGDLSPDPRNPRTISSESASGLSASLDEFGDIAGIVFNVRTGQLVSGHQRVTRLKEKYGDALSIVPVDGEWGHISTPDGNRFSVRFVQWEHEKQRVANVSANNPHIAGQFSSAVDDLLAEIRDNESEAMDRLRLSELCDESSGSGQSEVTPLLRRSGGQRMTWCLVGIETTRYGEIADYIQALANVDGIVMEMTANDGDKN